MVPSNVKAVRRGINPTHSFVPSVLALLVAEVFNIRRLIPRILNIRERQTNRRRRE